MAKFSEDNAAPVAWRHTNTETGHQGLWREKPDLSGPFVVEPLYASPVKAAPEIISGKEMDAIEAAAIAGHPLTVSSVKAGPDGWQDVAETLCAVDGNGFLQDTTVTMQSAYEIRGKAVAALYASPVKAAPGMWSVIEESAQIVESLTFAVIPDQMTIRETLSAFRLAVAKRIRALASPSPNSGEMRPDISPHEAMLEVGQLTDPVLEALRRMIAEFGDQHYHTCPANEDGPCDCFAGSLNASVRKIFDVALSSSREGEPNNATKNNPRR